MIPQEHYNIVGDWLRAIAKVREEYVPDDKKEAVDRITRKYVKNLSKNGYDLSKINAPIDYLNIPRN